MTNYSSIKESLLYFHDLCFDGEFTKTWVLETASERGISIPLRFFLSAWFGNVRPEVRAHEYFQSNIGRPYQIDFQIGDVALEVATTTYKESISKLYAKNNATEIQKLSKYNGKSILSLIDFREYDSKPKFEFLRDYERKNELGRGNHGITNYKIFYIYRYEDQSRCESVDAFPGR